MRLVIQPVLAGNASLPLPPSPGNKGGGSMNADPFPILQQQAQMIREHKHHMVADENQAKELSIQVATRRNAKSPTPLVYKIKAVCPPQTRT